MGRWESLIGYHLFQPVHRGRGVGTCALRLLLRYVTTATALHQLFIITGHENTASQRLAQICGFHARGGAREDPARLLVFAKEVLRGPQDRPADATSTSGR